MRSIFIIKSLLPLLLYLPSTLAPNTQQLQPPDDSPAFHSASELPPSSSSSSSSSYQPISSPPSQQASPAKVLYPDEDLSHSLLAWFRSGTEHNRNPGWMPIEDSLEHPAHHFDAKEWAARAEKGKKVGAEFTFTAGTRGEVPVEKVKGNLLVGGERGGEKGRGFRSQQANAIDGKRRVGRFNEGGLRSSARSHSIRQKAPTFAPSEDVTMGRHNSPTRKALDSARSKLDSLSSTPPLSRPKTPANSLSPNPPSTPPSLITHDKVQSWLTTSPPPPRKIAPYRMWSVPRSLPSINLHGYNKLTDRDPIAYSHWLKMLDSHRTLDFLESWTNSLQWAYDNRVQPTREARTTTLGIVTGSQVSTAPPRFLKDSENPRPVMESYELTLTSKRLYALRQLAELVPPALVGYSPDVYDKHEANGWNDVGVEEGKVKFHEKVHPIQYLNQMLRDRNGAVILENAIHGKLHQDLANTPQKAIAHLVSLRNKNRGARESDLARTTSGSSGGGRAEGWGEATSEFKGRQKGGAKGKETLEALLGTDYALYNKFHFPYYRDKPAFKIRNPLDTPLEDFPAFKTFADAVRLRGP
ncbi:uncharacterized protein UHOD_08856 [Ustilago sp. UG-2017b]|nr:uncharacterized protein UHOD_08856 [Ustilago sp. UG-2017b]